MRNTLVPVLLLATVALSSSNVLPILSMSEFKTEPLGFDGHQNDNTISNKYKNRNNLNDILYNIEEEPKYYQDNLDPEDGVTDENYNNAWNNNYDVKGFRKEQWHNYPRQLDRLRRQMYEDHDTDKRNLDPDDPSEEVLEAIPDNTPSLDIMKSNEVQDDMLNKAETAAAIINPLIILKIHLACMRKDKDNYETILNNVSNENKVDDILNEINPKGNLIKVKREEKNDSQTKRNESKNRVMKKRIFSLWSRLQSLNSRGHELHHRRHLYALYGLPDSEGGGGGGGLLTAETRATFMRPPGSPLRWG